MNFEWQSLVTSCRGTRWKITNKLNQKRKRDVASLCPCAGVKRRRQRLKNSRLDSTSPSVQDA